MIAIVDLPHNSIVGTVRRNGDRCAMGLKDVLPTVDRLVRESAIIPTEGMEYVRLAVDENGSIPIGGSVKEIIELLHTRLHRLNHVIARSGKRSHAVAVDDEDLAVFSASDELMRRARTIVGH